MPVKQQALQAAFQQLFSFINSTNGFTLQFRFFTTSTSRYDSSAKSI
jgi:hypothetical protein